MVLPWYSNNVASINHMFWYTEVFYTILPDTFSPFVFGIQNHSQILRPSWWGPLNNIDIWVLFDLKKQEKSPRAIYGSQRPEQPVNVNFKLIIRGLKSDIFDWEQV